MGKFVKSVDHFFDFCKEHEVKFVDFRFTDMNGAWHSITYNVSFRKRHTDGCELTRRVATDRKKRHADVP